MSIRLAFRFTKATKGQCHILTSLEFCICCFMDRNHEPLAAKGQFLLRNTKPQQWTTICLDHWSRCDLPACHIFHLLWTFNHESDNSGSSQRVHVHLFSTCRIDLSSKSISAATTHLIMGRANESMIPMIEYYSSLSSSSRSTLNEFVHNNRGGLLELVLPPSTRSGASEVLLVCPLHSIVSIGHLNPSPFPTSTPSSFYPLGGAFGAWRSLRFLCLT